jgi:hypothetical protein
MQTHPTRHPDINQPSAILTFASVKYVIASTEEEEQKFLKRLPRRRVVIRSPRPRPRWLRAVEEPAEVSSPQIEDDFLRIAPVGKDRPQG